MGLFSNLKKLRLKDIGTGKNLKKIGKGIKQMKFGEAAGLAALGFGGAGLLGAGPLKGLLGTGKWLGGGIKKLAGNKFVQKQAMNAAKGALQKSLAGQAPLQGAIPPMMPQGPMPPTTPQYTGQKFSSHYQPSPMPTIDYSQQNIGGYGGGWTGV
tara:strand:+ start:397 stop:861 length:465 start_codon:yes stop_codon:yes gene_type:complete